MIFKFLILGLLPYFGHSIYQVEIGIISGPEDDPRQNDQRFWDLSHNYSSPVRLRPVVHNVREWTSLPATRAICALAARGVRAFVSIAPARMNPIFISYSEKLSLPLITSQSTSGVMASGEFQLNFVPNTSKAVADLLRYYGWKEFVFFFDSEDNADHLQEVLRLMDLEAEVAAASRASTGEEAFRFLRLITPENDRRQILMATSEHVADELVSKMKAFRMDFHIILLKPVQHIERSDDLQQYGSYRITKFALVDKDKPLFKVLENRWKTMGHYRPRGRKSLPDSMFLMHDISSALYKAYSRLAIENSGAMLLENMTTYCLDEKPRISNETIALLPYMKNNIFEDGITGKIQFNAKGERINYLFHIVETTANSIRKIGNWSDSDGLKMAENFITKNQREVTETAARKSNQPIVVTTVIIPPFLQTKSNSSTYEGFIVDFLDEISEILHRPYRLQMPKDFRYGSKLENGEWTGMIGELLRGEADAAVAPLTKTEERAKVIHFSKNFINSGLNLLLKRPPQDQNPRRELGSFFFFAVWNPEVWVLLLLSLGCFACVSYGLSRFSGHPERIRALETKGSDRLSLCSAFWFTIGSMLMRNTGIYPRSLSHRLWTIIWWMFVLFFLMMYISSLSNTVIKSRTAIVSTHSRKTSHEILKEFIETGKPKIGALKGGATESFFKNSEIGIFRDIGRYFEESQDTLINAVQGIKRVKESDGNFAFIMESPSSEFIASKSCDLITSTGLLATRSYAIALAKDSPLKDAMDHAVLSLMESGTLWRLYEKWWRNSSSTCEDPQDNILPHVYNTALNFHEVSGIFYLLITFALVSIGAAFLERYFVSRGLSIENQKFEFNLNK